MIFHFIYIYTHTHIHTHTHMYMYIYHIFLSQSSIDRHLGCFHDLAIINNATMNTGVLVSFQVIVFGFSGYIPGSGIAGSLHMQ